MKYSPLFFYRTMPKWKRDKDSIVARFIHRPISFFFSSLFVQIGLTPNQVSFISLLIAIAACGCYLSNSQSCYLLGAILINIWSITDSADGNMARSLGGKPYGDFIDATSSYFLVGFIFPALGWAVYVNGGMLISKGNPLLILIGGFTGLFDTMTRLFYQKMKCNTYEIGQDFQGGKVEVQNNDSKIKKIQTRIESELGLGGWNMIFIIICSIFLALDYYIIFYFIYYGLVFIASTAFLIIKTKCLKR